MVIVQIEVKTVPPRVKKLKKDTTIYISACYRQMFFCDFLKNRII